MEKRRPSTSGARVGDQKRREAIPSTARPAPHSHPLPTLHLFTLARPHHSVNGWMAVQVGKARKRIGLAYPALYAPPGGDGDRFNCIQRGHQNTLEKLPLVLAMTVLSVFSYPIVGGVGAIVFVIGRCLYAWGYARAPAKRQYGSITYAGMFLLVGVNMAFAVQLFRGVGPY